MLDRYLNDSLDNQSLLDSSVVSDKKSQTNCYYCSMKKKYNIGQKGVHKCFEHSVAKTDHQTTSDLGDQNQSFMNASEMAETLEAVEESLDYYWENLKQMSRGNPNEIQRELQPVHESFKRVQEKMKKFFFSPSLEQTQTEPASQIKSNRKKYQCAGSQKFDKYQVSAFFDPEEQLQTDQMKEWISHFYKILQVRSIPNEESRQLPLQQDLQMRFFKESMERKFLSYAEELSKNEKKIHELLQKLIFYMEKSEGNVPANKIHEDITFIEMDSPAIEHEDNSLERVLMLQAMSVQFLLNNYEG